jgi:hypothetical protein
MHDLTLGDHPGIQGVHRRHGFFLPHLSAYIWFQIADFSLYFILRACSPVRLGLTS